MGGQQAYQWALSHPDFVDAIVSYCGAARTYPHGFVRLESAITAITADAAFNGGDYASPPLKGLIASAMHWAAWTRSQEWWRRELFRPEFPSVEAFLRQRIEASASIDANNHISHCRTWQQHDVGTTPGFDGDHQRALRSIKARVLSLPGQTDLYFPIGDAEYERQFIHRLTYTPIPSLWGHSAGGGSNPEDNAFLNHTIAAFLR
jgi:homoserine O-acetyltransferase